MTTVPGFASRHSDTTFRQFPHRDEAAMADAAAMNEPGWSNDNTDSPAKPVTEADSKAVQPEAVEDKAVTRRTTARKTTAKKG